MEYLYIDATVCHRIKFMNCERVQQNTFPMNTAGSHCIVWEWMMVYCRLKREPYLVSLLNVPTESKLQ